MNDPAKKAMELVSEFRHLGLDAYRDKLLEQRDSVEREDGYDISWGDLQDMKNRNFVRLARFVELVKSGVEVEAALEQAWKEVPERQL